MDTLLTLLLMGILYLGSKIWNFYLSKMNKSLEAHSSAVSAANNVSSQEGKTAKYVASNQELQSHVVPANVQNVPNVESEKSAWGGKLDHNMIVNGVIFAEILQPPRAYRPFVRR